MVRLFSFLLAALRLAAAEPRVVVLTFDDACVTHRTFVAPLLQKFGFGATFFVCEFPGVWGNAEQSLNWEQIKELHGMGFEIGNHTHTHRHVDKMNAAELDEELGYIEHRCVELGIPKPVSFAYPAYVHTPEAVKALETRGYRQARIGGGMRYDPKTDSPFLIPSISTTGKDDRRVMEALRKVEPGRIAVLTVHGVPDYGHPNVTTPPELFDKYLQFLKDEKFTVIALRDVPQYTATGGDWKSGIASLPETERAGWQVYLDKSAKFQKQQRDALAAELKASGLEKPLPAPQDGSFKWDKKDAADKDLAEVILSWQLPSGGWSKAIDYRKGSRQPGMQWTSQTDPWHYAATLDNRSTTDQLRFLAARHQAAPSASLAQSIQRGVQWLLDAQYPAGGWPQVYPLEGKYHDNITLNDDAMIHAMEVLTLVRDGAEGFDCVDAAIRSAAGPAVERGIRCLLACQQKRDGKPTAWCAQHDPVTLAPVGGRAYEPASLSGGESCEVVRYLMTIPKPDAATVAAVEGAIAWFASVPVPGEKSGDPPRWARFYDLAAHTAIFAGKADHKIYTDYTAMRANNPGGYDYFTTRPADLIGKWAERWRKRLP